jgi:hypothetical protein
MNTWYLNRLENDEEGDCIAMKIERNWNEKQFVRAEYE